MTEEMMEDVCFSKCSSDLQEHEHSFQVNRSSSPVHSDISLKSDRSMKMPINYSGDTQPPEDRSSSPVSSFISLKSDRSMKMPINYSGDTPLEDRCSSPEPSGVSLKSDRSMKMPINYSVEPPPEQRSSSPVHSSMSLKSDRSMKMPINYSVEERSSSPEPSVVSLKSDRSMKMPINYSVETSSEERSSSPVHSGVSLKNDRSMKMPINYSGDTQPPEDRSNSPVHSGVSLKSDRSMKMPINYSGDTPPEDRSSSPEPSGVSLKSDRSMKMPINYSGDTQPPEDSAVWTSGPRELMKTDHLNVDVNSREVRFDSDALKTLSEKLKVMFSEKYQNLLEGTAQLGKLIPLNKIYTELYIVEAVNEAHKHHHEVSHIQTMQKTVQSSTPIKCNNIFNPVPGQDETVKSVLTKGVAGIGKTVSVQKFVLDWAEGKANEDVRLIFPLTFRELNLIRNEKYSLNDLLQHFFLSGIDANSLRFANESIVMILDGLDECRFPLDFQNNEHLSDVTEVTSVDVLLTNLIRGNLLPSVKIWITSRPAAAHRIPNECVDRVTEVRGFSDPQKEEYFKKRISDQNLAEKIISHLKSLKSLYLMCHIPVFCWIVGSVLERTLDESGWDNIPKSLTQMYTHFLITQINTKKVKYPENQVSDQEMIFKLGKLAFEQLEKGNLIFYEEDLAECGIDIQEASVFSGVFTQIFREEFGIFQRKVFSFVHLSIQEHLAALYVFMSFQNLNRNVLDPQQSTDLTLSSLLQTAVSKASKNECGHLDLFLRFLMGFSVESNQILLQDLLKHRSSRPAEIQETINYLKKQIKESHCSHLFLICFHCLSELNDSSLTNEVQTFLKNKDLKEESLPRELWSALVFIIITSDEKLDVFDLSEYGKSDNALFYMMHVIKLSRVARFNNCDISVRGCAILTVALTILVTTRELDLSHNSFGDDGVKVLCTGIPADSAEKQRLVCSGITDERCSLQKHEHHSHHLVVDNTAKLLFSFMDNLNKKHDIKEFPGLQDTKCKIEKLRLKNCRVTSESCAFLASVLKSNSNLKQLELSQNNITDSGVKVLSEGLTEPSCKLETLTLNECKLTEESCSVLASVLSSESSCLRDLDLSNNDLKDSGVKLLCVGLRNPHCKLHNITLHNCSITEEGSALLNKAVESNSLLKVC